MNSLKVIVVVISALSLTACSTSKDDASYIAQKVCSSIKNDDLADIQDYFKSTVSANQMRNPQVIRDKFDCTITNVTQTSNANFTVEFESFYILKIRDFEGDFKVIGMSADNILSKLYSK